jgi:hypothetical protein
MKIRFLLVCALNGLACVPAARRGLWFSGLIVYHNEFRNAAGDVVTSSAGAEDLFYIQGNNYKLCASDKKAREVYLGKTHTLQTFQGGKVTTTSSPDTATHQPRVAVTRLPTTAVILGHPCQAVQLVRAGVSSIVYFSPELRVNANGFRQCPFGYWPALLQATDGALPLRTISVYSARGYTATSEATAVQALALSVRDFTSAAAAQ